MPVGLALAGMGTSRGVGNQHFFARPQARTCIINDSVAPTVDLSALDMDPDLLLGSRTWREGIRRRGTV